MQLVLLSGGSGKRLWPLSNNARSKQFLPLLEKEDGTMESMIQRVVRQARTAQLTNDITLATNTSQLDIITNQLGNNISIVTEPEHRDTFPAIALVACYLKFSKRCADDEVIVIMPCDPYIESDYFQTIRKIVECVDQDVADLVLMGISPTYPSPKYGYLVPQEAVLSNFNGAQMVSRFIEKPSIEIAEKLMKQHALWNGGVFAFRLGYIMTIVRKYITSDSFEDIRTHYSEFPKISFDYEVAEKAKSVAVVPYSGQWKDLGTWNSLTEELRRSTIGNVVMGAHCENTHVINELQHPIYVDGLKEVVVAACPDGILVCSKQHSEEIKEAVKDLTPRPMYEERLWGTSRVLDISTHDDGQHSLTKSITINPGQDIAYQIHHHRSEVWIFLEGEGIFVIDGKEQRIKAGDTVVIPIEHFHAIKALSKLTFIEIQRGNRLKEDDIEEFEWRWSE